MKTHAYFLTITLLAFFSGMSTFAQTGTIYGEAAERKLDEVVDVSVVTETLTLRTLGIAIRLNRFTLIEEPAFAQLYDTYASYILVDGKEKSVSNERDRSKVILLPFITAEEEASKPDLWQKSVDLAKEAGADYLFSGILDKAHTEPIEKEGTSSNVKEYVGYEGSIVFRLRLYNLSTDEELESREISDKGILNSGTVKAGRLALSGSKHLARFTGSRGVHAAGNASNQLNQLIDSAQPKTKAEALMQAINRSDKYIKEAISENFPSYYTYLSHQVDKSLEITFQNDLESELAVGHILELVTTQDGQEFILTEGSIKELTDDQFKITVTGKKIQPLLESLEENPELLQAKIGEGEENPQRQALRPSQVGSIMVVRYIK